jgi:hypothetical protein
MPVVAQPFQEAAGLLELFGLGPLGEVAADNDEVRVSFIHLLLDGIDNCRIMRSEVEIRQVN